MGWTRKTAAATILLVTAEQRQAMAARLAQRMEALGGWTNEKLAYEAGVSVKTVSRILNARHEPRGQTLERIAKAVGVDELELRGAAPAPLGLGRSAALIAGDDLVEHLARIEAELGQIRAGQRELLGLLTQDPAAASATLSDRIVAAVEHAMQQRAQGAGLRGRRQPQRPSAASEPRGA